MEIEEEKKIKGPETAKKITLEPKRIRNY